MTLPDRTVSMWKAGTDFTLAIFDALWDGYKYDKKPEVLRRTFVCPYILVTERNIPLFPIGSTMMVMAVLNLLE